MDSGTIQGIEDALGYCRGTHTIGDVARQVVAGRARVWEDDGAVIVTEINSYPQKRVLHFWLAAGELDKVIALSERVMDWGREAGCTRATLVGRRGWTKALQSEGWDEPPLTLMGREL